MSEAESKSDFSRAPVFLMGATACGKTDLSLFLAKTLDAEIISVDSALVYRGLDIGTAKPSMEERDGIPHHLIDICDPWEAYSAARFCNDASQLINEIQSRGKRALLVGGTMLYFKSLEEGLAILPDADAVLRQEMMDDAAARGWMALHQDLAKVDPVAAERIHPNDPQRIQRALEVHRLTGVPLTTLQKDTQSLLPEAPVKFALAPDNRAWLHERIQRRFAIMLEAGFLDEVRALKEDARIHAELPAIRSVGYRQAWEHLDASETNESEKASSDTAWVDKATAATRQLAKRQLTWLRGMDNVHYLACDALSLEEQKSTLCDILNTQETGFND